MILSINQPCFIPWLGYFDRIMRSDRHIILDHVQFEKNSFINRNRIRSKNDVHWLTIPVKTKNLFGHIPIHELVIDSTKPWRRKHWQSILMCYRSARFFRQYDSFFEGAFLDEKLSFIQLVDYINVFIQKHLGIYGHQFKSSELACDANKSDLVLTICQKFGATKYLSGPLGRNYLNIKDFDDAGIEVLYHDYIHPSYRQAYSGFFPYMSVIDLLFNHGPNSASIIRSTS